MTRGYRTFILKSGGSIKMPPHGFPFSSRQWWSDAFPKLMLANWGLGSQTIERLFVASPESGKNRGLI